MAKRTNRVAWGVAAVLALLLMIGVGTLLYYGMSFPGVSVRLAPPGSLPIRFTLAFYRERGLWEVSRPYDLRFCLVIVSRRYFQPELPPEVARQFGLKPDGRRLRTAPPAAPPASTRSGTGR